MSPLIRSMIGAAIGSFLVLAAVFMRQDVSDPTAEFITPPTEFAPLPVAAASVAAAGMILSKSPFDGDRGPFVRDQISVPTSVDVRLTGIVGMAGARRATLVINGSAQTVITGDNTPLGTVTAIESNAVLFNDGRRLVLFE